MIDEHALLYKDRVVRFVQRAGWNFDLAKTLFDSCPVPPDFDVAEFLKQFNKLKECYSDANKE